MLAARWGVDVGTGALSVHNLKALVPVVLYPSGTDLHSDTEKVRLDGRREYRLASRFGTRLGLVRRSGVEEGSDLALGEIRGASELTLYPRSRHCERCIRSRTTQWGSIGDER